MDAMTDEWRAARAMLVDELARLRRQFSCGDFPGALFPGALPAVRTDRVPAPAMPMAAGFATATAVLR